MKSYAQHAVHAVQSCSKMEKLQAMSYILTVYVHVIIFNHINSVAVIHTVKFTWVQFKVNFSNLFTLQWYSTNAIMIENSIYLF